MLEVQNQETKRLHEFKGFNKHMENKEIQII